MGDAGFGGWRVFQVYNRKITEQSGAKLPKTRLPLVWMPWPWAGSRRMSISLRGDSSGIPGVKVGNFTIIFIIFAMILQQIESKYVHY